ncbi:MAG TPA: DsbA family oxidoreductase [Chloroflexota bacterium]|nr:DsbA family oxidoreductase [Chloroflexota bacterium]
MNVEIWSDIVCPWCYIGKRRFEAALARFAHRDAARVTWRSFELDPTASPRPAGTLDELLARKYGQTVEQAAAGHARLTALAAEDGLEYHFDRAQHGNTFDAHRLTHLAAALGLQDAMEERLMRAYFTEGLPIGDPDTLIQLAVEVGIDAEEARTALAGDAYAAEVRADEERAGAFGIRGVPFMVVDEAYGVSGAQPASVFLDALEKGWAARAGR